MRLHFVRGRGWSSSLIAVKTGLYSHVDIEMPDGRLLGARWDKADGKAGVEIRRPNYEAWDHKMVLEIATGTRWDDLGWPWLEQQLHKPYDWRAIAAFAFARNWRDEDAWFCSELAIRLGEVMKIFGEPEHNYELYLLENQIDPGGCALAYQAAGGWVYSRR